MFMFDVIWFSDFDFGCSYKYNWIDYINIIYRDPHPPQYVSPIGNITESELIKIAESSFWKHHNDKTSKLVLMSTQDQPIYNKSTPIYEHPNTWAEKRVTDVYYEYGVLN